MPNSSRLNCLKVAAKLLLSSRHNEGEETWCWGNNGRLLSKSRQGIAGASGRQIAAAAFIDILCMQLESVYWVTFKITLVPLLFGWHWAKTIKWLVQNEPSFITPHLLWRVFAEKKNSSLLWGKDTSIDIKKSTESLLCPLHCVTDSLICVISMPKHRWLLRFYYLPFCTWRAVGHPSQVKPSAQTSRSGPPPTLPWLSPNVRWCRASRSVRNT